MTEAAGPTRVPREHLNDLQAFVTVARTRSFRRAAAELGLSPSALSHALRGLEARLGLRLLHRTTRSVAPTEAGERLYARLAPALTDIAEALDEINAFRGEARGTLRLNAPRAACDLVLADLVTRFVAAYPGMGVELVSDDALVDIVAAGFDAGVRFGESLQQDMVAVPLGPPQRFVVVGSPDYLARRGTPDCPRALLEHACLRIRFPHGREFPWDFQQGAERIEIKVQGPLAYAVGDMALMVAAAERGLGLAYVYTQYAAKALAAGRLITVLDPWRPPETGFFLYYPSHRHPPTPLRAFIDLARQVYPSNAPG